MFAHDRGQWVTRGYVRHLWVMIHNAVGEVILEKGGRGEREKKKAKVIHVGWHSFDMPPSKYVIKIECAEFEEILFWFWRGWTTQVNTKLQPMKLKLLNIPKG